MSWWEWILVVFIGLPIAVVLCEALLTLFRH